MIIKDFFHNLIVKDKVELFKLFKTAFHIHPADNEPLLLHYKDLHSRSICEYH